ncbi:MAG: LapA family protein [bacterium]|nr:LapA family protein [bacterium]
MMYLYLVIVFIVAFFIALFVQINNYPINLNYFWGTKEVSLALALFIAFVIGFLIAVIARVPQDLAIKRRFRSLERELFEKENRLKSYYISQSSSQTQEKAEGEQKS